MGIGGRIRCGVIQQNTDRGKNRAAGKKEQGNQVFEAGNQLGTRVNPRASKLIKETDWSYQKKTGSRLGQKGLQPVGVKWWSRVIEKNVFGGSEE